MASSSGSLFGGSGLGPSTTSQLPSVFSTSNPTSAFGNQSTATAQGAQTSSLFGAQSQTQQQPLRPSVLGQTQQQPNNAPAQGPPSSQTTQPAFFNSLLERGKKRPLSAAGQNGSFDEIPSLQLGLDDIRRKARELGGGGQKDSQQHGPTGKA